MTGPDGCCGLLAVWIACAAVSASGTPVGNGANAASNTAAYSFTNVVQSKGTPLSTSTPDLIPFRKGNKWGFCDRHKKIIVAPQYDAVWRFYDGLAAVSLNGKTEFVDRTGRVVIALKYGQGRAFSEGLAAVKSDEKYGYINKAGVMVIPAKYDQAFDFSEGLAQVFTVLNKANGIYGFINKTGREITPLKYDLAHSFSEDLAGVCVGDSHKGQQQCGYVDKTGKEVIALQYYSAHSFSDGLAHVRKPDASGKILDGFIDKSGTVVLPFSQEYYLVDDFHEGLLAVHDHYVDKNGRTVLTPGYESLGQFSEGLAKVEMNGKYGYMDKSGKLVIPAQYEKPPGPTFCNNLDDKFHEGLAAIEKDGKCGFIDKTGRPITAFKYTSVGKFEHGLAYVELGTSNSGGYIGRDGTEYFEQ